MAESLATSVSSLKNKRGDFAGDIAALSWVHARLRAHVIDKWEIA
jgi:hypothetical protein